MYGKTQGEVARRIAEVRRERDTGLPVQTERRSVASYLDSWLEMVKVSVEPNTYRSYEYTVRVHIKPQLGKLQLVKLTPEVVQRWLAQKRSERPSGPTRESDKLSLRTVANCHTVLHIALNEAVKLGLVGRNAATGVRKPKAERRESKWWTREQARQVLSAARREPKAQRFYAFFMLALSTGMRESELFGLRWSDVDLAKRSLHVQTQLQWKRTSAPDGRMVPHFKRLKSDGSRRRIAISAAVAEALKAHRKAQVGERMKLGPIWRENDLVFCNSIGGGLLLTNFRRNVYLPVVARAGVPYIRPHDMRHTAATLAILDGMPIKAVSEMLGHSSVAITMTIYAHVLPDSHAQVAESMERLLFAER